jgi:hypothetical protein
MTPAFDRCEDLVWNKLEAYERSQIIPVEKLRLDRLPVELPGLKQKGF